MSVAAWVVARAGREEQVGVVEAARAPEAAVERAQAKLGQEVAAARARETRAVAVAEAAVAVVKAAEAGVAQEPLGLVAAVGRAQAAPAAVVEAGMAPESPSRPESARRTALIQRKRLNGPRSAERFAKAYREITQSRFAVLLRQSRGPRESRFRCITEHNLAALLWLTDTTRAFDSMFPARRGIQKSNTYLLLPTKSVIG